MGGTNRSYQPLIHCIHVLCCCWRCGGVVVVWWRGPLFPSLSSVRVAAGRSLAVLWWSVRPASFPRSLPPSLRAPCFFRTYVRACVDATHPVDYTACRGMDGRMVRDSAMVDRTKESVLLSELARRTDILNSPGGCLACMMLISDVFVPISLCRSIEM